MKGRRLALVNIDWDETSGVNNAANELDNSWMVLKAASADSKLNGDDDNDGDVDDSEVIAELLSDFLEDAPQEVVDAAQKVIDYIATQSDEDEDDAGTASDDAKQTTKSAKKSHRFVDFLKSLVPGTETKIDPQQVFNEKLDIFVKGLRPGMTPQEKYAAIQELKQSMRGE